MAKRWKVVGTQPVFGHAPGETFEQDIPEDQEAFLKQIGAIEPAKGRPPEKKADKSKIGVVRPSAQGRGPLSGKSGGLAALW